MTQAPQNLRRVHHLDGGGGETGAGPHVALLAGDEAARAAARFQRLLPFQRQQAQRRQIAAAAGLRQPVHGGVGLARIGRSDEQPQLADHRPRRGEAVEIHAHAGRVLQLFSADLQPDAGGGGGEGFLQRVQQGLQAGNPPAEPDDAAQLLRVALGPPRVAEPGGAFGHRGEPGIHPAPRLVDGRRGQTGGLDLLAQRLGLGTAKALLRGQQPPQLGLDVRQRAKRDLETQLQGAIGAGDRHRLHDGDGPAGRRAVRVHLDAVAAHDGGDGAQGIAAVELVGGAGGLARVRGGSVVGHRVQCLCLSHARTTMPGSWEQSNRRASFGAGRARRGTASVRGLLYMG